MSGHCGLGQTHPSAGTAWECRAAAVGLLDQLGAVQVLPWVSSQDPHLGANPALRDLLLLPSHSESASR